MITNTLTKDDKMLQIVLSDENLAAFGEYNPTDYESIEEGLSSDKPIVVAVAKMIQGLGRKSSEKEIYNEVSNYLKSNLI